MVVRAEYLPVGEGAEADGGIVRVAAAPAVEHEERLGRQHVLSNFPAPQIVVTKSFQGKLHFPFAPDLSEHVQIMAESEIMVQTGHAHPASEKIDTDIQTIVAYPSVPLEQGLGIIEQHLAISDNRPVQSAWLVTHPVVANEFSRSETGIGGDERPEGVVIHSPHYECLGQTRIPVGEIIIVMDIKRRIVFVRGSVTIQVQVGKTT